MLLMRDVLKPISRVGERVDLLLHLAYHERGESLRRYQPPVRQEDKLVVKYKAEINRTMNKEIDNYRRIHYYDYVYSKVTSWKRCVLVK